jgi:hypothetical protein
MRHLQHPQTLKQAVELVIESNIADNYRPQRFIGITEYGNASNLFEICHNLIHKGELLEDLERAVKHHPALLTLEDFVCRYGREWHFDAATIEQACGRRVYFDGIAKQTRYE